MDQDQAARRRIHALWVLGNIGDPGYAPHIIEVLKDNYPEVRTGALDALVKIAGKADVDLDKVRNSLEEVVNRTEDPKEREGAKQWAASAYAKIAKAVSERRQSYMPGEMLPARIKPPKKGMYRMRRVANG